MLQYRESRISLPTGGGHVLSGAPGRQTKTRSTSKVCVISAVRELWGFSAERREGEMLQSLQMRSSFVGLKIAHTLRLRAGSFSRCGDGGASKGDRQRRGTGQDARTAQLRFTLASDVLSLRNTPSLLGLSRAPREPTGCNAPENCHFCKI